jgi:beta-lactamase regulating signal transducer with metallopeptidase domain
MIPASLLDNLLPWVIQISLVSLLGTALPLVLGVRHPRTQLVYGYLVLALCLLLPFLQPRVESTRQVAATEGASVVPAELATAESPAESPRASQASTRKPSNPRTVTPGPEGPGLREPNPRTPESTSALRATADAPSNLRTFSTVWRAVLFWVLVAGAVFRLARLAIGAWQIRRFRLAASPLYPVPETVTGAEALVRARAVVCLSHDVSSPATLGVFRPVVLMPASFLTLDDDAQQAIACHELLHVRRLDWAVALVEGVISALLWFCPVTWLISEIRLAREQLVDGEVVRLTAEKDSYIQALLQIARARPTLDIVPAPLFIRRRHLTHRVQMLLEGASNSLRRLSVCYASSTAILVGGAALAVAWFPLVTMPQVVHAATPGVVETLPARSDSLKETPSSAALVATAPAAAPKAGTVPASVERQADEWAEPIVGPITTAASPADRAAVLALLEQARQNSDLHIAGTPPYHLEATFDASGPVTDVGSGELSETWLSGQRWRWTAMLGGYSSVRIGSGRTGYDAEPDKPLPMRAHMLRRVIFGPLPATKPGRIRTASARVAGAAVTCVLLAPAATPESPARMWQEDEYCIDAAGLLRVHSPSRGAYTRLDYSRALRFGGRVLPGDLRAYLDGVEVARARLTIRSAADVDDALFTATPEMIARGPAPTTGFAQKVLLRAPAPHVVPGAAVTVVHASVDASGAVLEAEVASGDPQLSTAALEIVRAHRFPNTGMQRDAYIGVDFSAPADATP